MGYSIREVGIAVFITGDGEVGSGGEVLLTNEKDGNMVEC
jgi:hypothetical protein